MESWYEFTNWADEKFGWLIGTGPDELKQFDLVKPQKNDGETIAEFARRLANAKVKFKKEYWKKAKIKRITLAIGIFLLFTNPSLRAFKEHRGLNTYTGISRQCNFFIFSIYRFKEEYYVGIGENFILVLYY